MKAIRALVTRAGSASEAMLLEPELAGVLRRKRDRIAASHGYIGHAVGWKRSDGRIVPELAIVVFVERKLSDMQLRRTVKPSVPPEFKTDRGQSIRTDVVEFALGAKQAVTACPGASTASSIAPNPGTLAFFARTAAGRLVGVTAGHVAYRSGAYDLPARSGQVVGVLDQTLASPVDAATIEIQSPHTQQFPTGGAMAGWRQITQYDIGETVQLYGAQSGTWNAGIVEYLAPWISNWKLADAIIYSSASIGGDSGGPVIDLDRNLVGIHVGRGTCQGRDVAIANSIVRVISELSINPEFEDL